MTKAIFLDLDGTLLNFKNELTKQSILSIKKVKEKGYDVFLITGKSFENSKEVYEKLNLNNELITYGGQVISQKFNSKYVHEKIFLNFQKVKNILQDPLIQNKIAYFLIETENTFFQNNSDNDFLIDLLKSKKQEVKTFNSYKNENILGFYFDIKTENSQKSLALTKKLRKNNPDLFISYWDTHYPFTTIKASPKEATKWNVIQKLKTKHLFDQIITFGNGYTDIEMIDKADIGYAMQNAFDSVKKHANKVTTFDNDHNGVAIELDKLK